MRYVTARWKEKQRDDAYRIYITDALMAISNNTMTFGGGSSISVRFADLIYRKQDTRTGDEVAADVIKRAGLTLAGRKDELT